MNELPGLRRRWAVWTLRAAVLVIVLYGVRGTILAALQQLAPHSWHVEPVWLVVAGSIYAAGLLPMAWFWHRALASLGQPAPWTASLRAYFLGHLGKYVPGKALAIVLRVAAVQQWVHSIRVALICSLLETLTMMAVGACLSTVLLAALRVDVRIVALAAGLALALGLPTLPPSARWLARIGDERWKRRPDNGSHAPDLHRMSWRLLTAGWLAAALCWSLLGMSLWATLRAMGVAVDPLHELPMVIAAVAFAVVAGFASLLPGGLGVRDLVLTELLAPSCGAANALVAAVLMRLVWLVSELAVCVILYVAAKFR
jgi:uncharacterized membrane protein YbhN (UPF0104 family)